MADVTPNQTDSVPVTPNTQVEFDVVGRTVSQRTPFKGSTRAGDADQTRARADLGSFNNQDMFLQDIDKFLEHYAPCKVDDDRVIQCILRLSAGATPEINVSNDKDNKNVYDWERFPVYTDQYKGKFGHEDIVFAPLKNIIDAIIQQKDSANDLEFQLCPRTTIDGDIEGGNHLIDGCFVDRSERFVPGPGNKISHRAIKIPIELKKARNVDDREEVHQQILGASHHILNEDPRRMCIYGITIERNWMSVWYFSRSHSVKTYAFDWMVDIETTIKVILSFAYATPAQLGVDPSVHIGPKIRADLTRSYIYEVPNEKINMPPTFYKTIRSLFPERPMCIAGRVTRIWEVVQVTSSDGLDEVNPERRLVLKDVWLDEGANSEAKNMDQIFQAVDDFVAAGIAVKLAEEQILNPDFTLTPDTERRLLGKFINSEPRFSAFDPPTKSRLLKYFTNQSYRGLFLTKVHAWSGMVSKPLGPNVRHFPTLFPKVRYNNNKHSGGTVTTNVMSRKANSRVALSQPQIELITNLPRNSMAKDEEVSARLFVPKQQSRFVYEEVCTTLHRLPTLGEVVEVLCQAIDALHILYSVDWVHRDISTGNILAIHTDSGWRVKLADLEFSRVMVDEQRISRSDPRTGTAFFMPTEILSRSYLFASFLQRATTKAMNGSDEDEDPEVDDYEDDKDSKEETEFWGETVKKDVVTRFTLAEQLGLDDNEAYAPFKAFASVPFITKQMVVSANLDLSKIPAPNSTVNHNFQHDLESIWWILLWFITKGVDSHLASIWADPLFQYNVENFHARFILFEQPVLMNHTVGPYLDPQLQKHFPTMLNTLRSAMYEDCVTRTILGKLEVPESYSDIHARFSTLFRQLSLRKGDWRSLPITYDGTIGLMKFPGSGAPQAGTKRGRDHDDDVTLTKQFSKKVKIDI